MMTPAVRDNIFNRLFNFDLPDGWLMPVRNAENAVMSMNADIKEFDDKYELKVDLPGFKKEEIEISLDKDYLKISASRSVDKDEKDDEGKVIRKERYSGSMERMFNVGEGVEAEDVKASFENGVLTVDIPKKEPSLPEKKLIQIEG